jgi:hypothetical protein
MKKGFFVFMVLLVWMGMECFAQTDVRVRALQGEWTMISLQQGDQFFDLTKATEGGITWKFEGNNFFSVTINPQTRKNEVVTGTFTIVGNSLGTSVQGQDDAMPYTIQGNTLTVTGPDGAVFVFNKRQ